MNLDNLNDNYSHLFNSVDTINAFTQNNSNVGAYLIQNINSRKYGMISIQAHGEPTYWATSYDSGGQEESWLTSLDSYPAGINNENQDNNGLDNLDNKFSPNIIYSQGCTTMPFDNYYHPTLPSNQINCGDSFTLGSKYGGGHILDIREHLI